jgi:hypothetical protein
VLPACRGFCEQFAEFSANRPIVLEADVILKR